MWWLNVKYVDTYALDRLDRYQLWAQIRHELTLKTDKAPWLLTTDEIHILEDYLKPHRCETTLQIQLEEAYDFADPSYTAYVPKAEKGLNNLDIAKNITRTISQVSKDLNMPNSAALKNAIKDFVKSRAPETIFIGKYVIKRGVLNHNGRDRYYMPPIRNEDWDNIDE